MQSQSLLTRFKNASILIQLVVVNTLLYICSATIIFLLQLPEASVLQWVVLSDTFSEVVWKPWTLITYGFFHGNFYHLFWNMIWLFVFGSYIRNLFPPKRLLTLFLLGILYGGCLYLIAYNVFPVFFNKTGYLLGASAGVMAVMVFIATYTPQARVHVFVFSLALWQVALFFVISDIIRLPTSGNAGGLIAHLGGAIFGYIYAKQLLNGKDIGLWFEQFLGFFVNIFKPKKTTPFKKVHRNTKRQTSKNTRPSTHQEKIDAILDKIGKSGYESLSEAEKEFLFRAGGKE